MNFIWFCSISSVQNWLLRYAEDEWESAHKLIDEMSERDVICWSVMIGGYVYFEKAQIGMKVHQKMVYELGIEPDGVSAVNVPKPALV